MAQAGFMAQLSPQLPEGDVLIEPQAVIPLFLGHVAPFLPVGTGRTGWASEWLGTLPPLLCGAGSLHWLLDTWGSGLGVPSTRGCHLSGDPQNQHLLLA